MNKATIQQSIFYPFLLLIVMSEFSFGRYEKILINGIGRNTIWFFVPLMLLFCLGVWLSLQISKRFDRKSIMIAAGKIGGTWLSKVTYFLYAILFMGMTGYVFILNNDFFSRTLLYGSTTKISLFSAVILMITAAFPFEAMARFAHILVIFVLPIFIIVLLTTMTNAHWNWIQPIFHMKGLIDPFSSFGAASIVFSPLASVTLMFNKNRKVTFTQIVVVIAFIVLMVSFMFAAGIATFGLETARGITYLSHYLLGAVRIENFFFERVLYISIISWKLFEFVGSAFLLRCTALCVSQIFGIRLRLWLIILLTSILAGVTLQFNLIFQLSNWLVGLGYYSFLMIVCYPMLLYVLMLIRWRKLQ